MHLDIKLHVNEGITIFDLKGKIVLGPEDSALREQLQSLLDAGTRNIILNLRDVSHIDTAALGTMVHFTTKLRDAGGKLALLNIAPAHADLAELMKLDTVIESYHDELDAVNSFFPDRKIVHYDILEFVEEIEHEKQAESKESTEVRKG